MLFVGGIDTKRDRAGAQLFEERRLLSIAERLVSPDGLTQPPLQQVPNSTAHERVWKEPGLGAPCNQPYHRRCLFTLQRR